MYMYVCLYLSLSLSLYVYVYVYSIYIYIYICIIYLSQATACLERNESVLVAAHTSAGACGPFSPTLAD